MLVCHGPLLHEVRLHVWRQRVKWRHALRGPRRGEAVLLWLSVRRRRRWWAPALNHALPSTLSHVGERLRGPGESRAWPARPWAECLYAPHPLMLCHDCRPNPGGVQVTVRRHGSHPLLLLLLQRGSSR